MVAADWGRDPSVIREYVKMANADGYRPASMDQGRGVLLRYSAFLRAHYHRSLDRAGWKEFLAYKNDLLGRHLMRTTIRSCLSYIAGFYSLKAQATQSGKYLDKFASVPRRLFDTSGSPTPIRAGASHNDTEPRSSLLPWTADFE